jgi:hypothetical protein
VLVESQRGHGSSSCSGGGLWPLLGGLRCSLESDEGICGFSLILACAFCGFLRLESCGLDVNDR